MIKKAQATLEFVMSFIILAALIMGLLNLWEWSKNNLGARQKAYESSRVQAGQQESPGEPELSYDAQAKPVIDSQTYMFR